MAVDTKMLSLTRPKEPQKLYGATFWQFGGGLALAVIGAMLLMILFIISAVVADWVSDLTNPAKSAEVLASRFGRVITYQAWLSPVATTSIGLIMVGIAVVLWGIVRRLWVRVESVKESLPALMKRGGDS